MAKNKKITRKALLRGPDEFLTLSARAVLFAKAHSREFGYIGSAVAIVVLIYLGVNTYMNYVNKKGQKAYNEAYYTFVKDAGPVKDKKTIEQSKKLFQEVIDRYGLSRVSRLAIPETAYLSFLEKKYDESISAYQQFIKKTSEEKSYLSLARMAMAACYEEKGEFKKAVEILESLATSTDLFSREQTMLSLARVYRLTHQKEKARGILEEFTKEFQDSPFLPLAKAHLNRIPDASTDVKK